MSERIFALSDCANFYASCESMFIPSLRDRPVVVLSNNDGNCVARSAAAKALGIKMGAPFHELKDLIAKHGVRVFSSNYALYGDLSARVSAVYERYSPDVETYSIDESFLDFRGFRDREAHARKLIQEVQRCTGMDVRIGCGRTKTLSKAANEVAKKNPMYRGFLDMMDDSVTAHVLPLVKVGDVWGIGRATAPKLHAQGIHTAADLRDMPLKLARKLGTVVLERTVAELRGTSCLELEDVEPPRKGMASTRSAGVPMEDFNTVMESLTCRATKAAEKLRKHGLVAGRLNAFYHTSRYRENEPQYRGSRTAHLTPMTNDTLRLVAAARRCAEAAWPGDGRGFRFVKSGVMLDDLVAEADRPRTLFEEPDVKGPALMAALDAVNDRFGRDTLCVASEGTKRSWAMRANHLSPRYTTRISDLPVVRLG